MSSERLQKILARAGIGSRRAAERVIADGRVRLNGKIVKELGTKADTVRDRVEVDGKRLVAEHPVYYLLHKPREVVTTLADPEQRESIAELMKDVRERVFPVGRLDYHTSGALLLTNDGEMAQALLHPRKKVPKVYVAKFRGELSLAQLQSLREGVVLDGGETTRKAEVFVTRVERGNTWLQMTITEGKNRQIHRMGEAIGRRVMRLFRLSFADLSVDGLRPGEHRPLGDSELAKLKRDYFNPSQRDKFEQAKTQRRERAAFDAGQGSDRGNDRRRPFPGRVGGPRLAKRDARERTGTAERDARERGIRERDAAGRDERAQHATKRARPERIAPARDMLEPDTSRRGIHQRQNIKRDVRERHPSKGVAVERDVSDDILRRDVTKGDRARRDDSKRDNSTRAPIKGHKSEPNASKWDTRVRETPKRSTRDPRPPHPSRRRRGTTTASRKKHRTETG